MPVPDHEIFEVTAEAPRSAEVPPSTGPFPTMAAVTDPGAAATAASPNIPGYEILEQLAPGGMGVVYRARRAGRDDTVAVKMIRSGLHAGAQERARFRVEADAVASLSHPHVIEIHECGEWNGMPYLVMEFAAGGSLAQRLEHGIPLPLAAAELVETLARAVHYVHERGVIHRDLKPANILLSDRGVPKLADFGLAKRLDHDQGLTQTHAVLGTASYMAPEQAAGDTHAVGPAADIYALGAILYELLTGQPPFQAETRELTIHRVLSEEPLPPTQLRADVPEQLEAICLKCLEKNPPLRFTSALSLAEDLRRFQRAEPISISSSGAFDRHVRAARRLGYEILYALGPAVGGDAFRARHVSLNRIVVLEMIAAGSRIEPMRLERQRTEAEAVAQLHHPNIVEVYDFGELNGAPFIAREYLEGGSLADKLFGPLQPAAQSAALVETLARAVHYAHLRGVVHGHLKPTNVLLAGDGTCKIAGFGLASGDATASGQGADIYLLGAILYELLVGRPPRAENAAGVAPEQPRSAAAETLRQARPELPRELAAICLNCLDREPGRYPSAAALAEDLRRFRTGEVLFIDDLDDWSQQQRWARRAGYEVLELLGQGSDGFTYKVRQRELDRVMVLKRISAQYRFVPAAKDRFRWEARLLARLRHPNIVQFHDQGEQNDLAYFVVDFVDGPALSEIAAHALQPLPLGNAGPEQKSWEDVVDDAVELVQALARAIHFAHAAGIIHGGVNPSNIRLTSAGIPKITSFRRLKLPTPATATLPPDTDICRLAGFLAPEQCEGGRRMLDASVDVYALGAVLYALLTGRSPFLGQTLEETLLLVRSEAPLSPRNGQPAIPVDLENICLSCLEKQPGQRPASAEALADALLRVSESMSAR